MAHRIITNTRLVYNEYKPSIVVEETITIPTMEYIEFRLFKLGIKESPDAIDSVEDALIAKLAKIAENMRYGKYNNMFDAIVDIQYVKDTLEYVALLHKIINEKANNDSVKLTEADLQSEAQLNTLENQPIEQ